MPLFLHSGPRELPSDVPLKRVIEIVGGKCCALPASAGSGARRAWRRAIQSDESKAIVTDAFWYVNACVARRAQTIVPGMPAEGEGPFLLPDPQRGHSDEWALFERMAANYAQLCTHVPKPHRDVVLNQYYNMVAQSVWVALYTAFPTSGALLGLHFKRALLSSVSRWFTGVAAPTKLALLWTSSPEEFIEDAEYNSAMKVRARALLLQQLKSSHDLNKRFATYAPLPLDSRGRRVKVGAASPIRVGARSSLVAGSLYRKAVRAPTLLCHSLLYDIHLSQLRSETLIHNSPLAIKVGLTTFPSANTDAAGLPTPDERTIHDAVKEVRTTRRARLSEFRTAVKKDAAEARVARMQLKKDVAAIEKEYSDRKRMETLKSKVCAEMDAPEERLASRASGRTSASRASSRHAVGSRSASRASART